MRVYKNKKRLNLQQSHKTKHRKILPSNLNKKNSVCSEVFIPQRKWSLGVSGRVRGECRVYPHKNSPVMLRITRTIVAHLNTRNTGPLTRRDGAKIKANRSKRFAPKNNKKTGS